MKFIELKAHIKQGNLLPCYAVVGDDPFLIHRAKKMFYSVFSAFPEFNITVFQEGASATDITQTAQTLPLMSDRRLIVAPISLLKDLDTYLKSPNPSTILFLFGSALPANAKSIPCQLVDCNRLETDNMVKFIQIECKRRGTQIDASAINMLIQLCNHSTGKVVTELDKLSAYKLDGLITADDVRINVTPSLEYRAYELTNAIVKKDSRRAKAILDDMLSSSDAGAKVFGLIYSHIRKLMYASLSNNETEIANAFGMKEFLAKSIMYQSKYFSKLQLKQLLDKLHNADTLIKNFSGDKTVLSSIIYEVISL